MKFVKYNDIENSYRQKFLSKFDDDIYSKQCVILEKIDGCSFQIKISKDEMKFGKRKSFLGDDASFNNFQSAVAKIQSCLNTLYDNILHNYDDCVITLYGELCGRGIQNRVNYGDEKQLLFFDVHIETPFDSGFLSFDEMEIFFNKYNLPMVPVVKRNIFLKDVLNFEVEGVNSMVLGINDNEWEGFVARPMYEEIYNYHNQRLIVKKKTKKCTERTKIIKPKEIDSVTMIWSKIIESYITENRVLSVFSKEGEIDDPKQIGQYIKWMMVDVREELVKDYPDFETIDKTKQKKLLNIGGKVVKILNKYL